ncbi:hypothetical protein RB195_016984 [Necator americanus]|uniref:Uncharacterized protein n=1 Tax=Necator americanus TaxID=51031 RepID=A0ABR1C314_NECAM
MQLRGGWRTDLIILQPLARACGEYTKKIWKESKVYKADTDQARCMEAYKKACDNKEIIVGGIRRRPGDKYSDDYESLEDID